MMGDFVGEIAAPEEELETRASFFSPRLKSFLISLEAVMVLAGGEAEDRRRGEIQSLTSSC